MLNDSTSDGFSFSVELLLRIRMLHIIEKLRFKQAVDIIILLPDAVDVLLRLTTYWSIQRCFSLTIFSSPGYAVSHINRCRNAERMFNGLHGCESGRADRYVNTAAIRDGGERSLAGQKRNNQSVYIRRSMSKCIFNWIWWCLWSCGEVFGAQLRKLPSSIALDLHELENWFLQTCQTLLKGSRSMETWLTTSDQFAEGSEETGWMLITGQI